MGEAVNMDKQGFKDVCRALGLKSGSDGIVTDGVFDYVRLDSDGRAITPSKDIYPVADIEIAGFLPDVHRLDIRVGGELIELYGDKFGSAFGEDGDLTLRSMPLQVSTMNDAFDVLYPMADIQLYYDVLMEREYIDMAMLDRPDEGVVPISDMAMAKYHDHVQRRLRSCGYSGSRYPSNQVMDEALLLRASAHQRNRFREWVEAHEWDGKPRLRTVFMDYCGATAPPLEDGGKPSDDERRYIGDVTEAWFLGAIRRMYKETVHEVVPVLIGAQGAGKNHFLRYISGSNEWYRSTVADVTKVDRFLESVRGGVVVELAESKQVRTQDNESLKAFISQSSDQIRKPYARYDETYPRRFVFIATSNSPNVFTDPTGSRRFYPMFCNPDYATRTYPTIARGREYQYEVEQIWAEALQLYKQGHKWFIRRDSAILAARMQEYCSETSPGEQAINDYLDDPSNGYVERGARISNEVLYRDILGVSYTLPPLEARYAVNAWVRGTVGRAWIKVEKPFYLDGKTVRGYERRMRPDDDRTTRTFLMDSDDGLRPSQLVSEFRAMLREQGISRLDADISMEGVADNVVTSLQDAGFISNTGTSEAPRFRVSGLP